MSKCAEKNVSEFFELYLWVKSFSGLENRQKPIFGNFFLNNEVKTRKRTPGCPYKNVRTNFWKKFRVNRTSTFREKLEKPPSMGLPARSQRYLSAKSVFFEAIANRFFKF
jgi:hypothetical protein